MEWSVAPMNIDKIIADVENKIQAVSDKLICDEWEDSKKEIYKIIESLNTILKNLASKEEELGLVERWVAIVDALLKAIKFEDTIQLADLLIYDTMQMLNNTMEAAGN